MDITLFARDKFLSALTPVRVSLGLAVKIIWLISGNIIKLKV